jgi:hypothetical protein
MNKETERKLQIENLTRCMNCSRFGTCSEKEKENIVDCLHYREVGVQSRVFVGSLKECCSRESIDSKVIKEVVDELRGMTSILGQELVPLSDGQLANRIAKCADSLIKLVRFKAE